jgi:hypothetical protein
VILSVRIVGGITVTKTLSFLISLKLMLTRTSLFRETDVVTLAVLQLQSTVANAIAKNNFFIYKDCIIKVIGP